MEREGGRTMHRRLGSMDCSETEERRLSLSPERVSDVERRSFLRAYSRKSLESNPEDEEFVVGDDGTINVVAVDDRARLERLRQVLEKKERETRLAAEYGLSLLESNEELHVEIESLKIQHEAETAELAADRDLYQRRHELALQEVESWKSESKRHEELKYQLSVELERLTSRCECLTDGGRSSGPKQQQQRIAELEATVAELQATEAAQTAVIRALKQWKAMHESAQKEQADMAYEESASEKLYAAKLEQDKARLRQQVDALQSEKRRLEELLSEAEQALKHARHEMDELHSKVKTKEIEMHAQAERLLTAESKCGRLERERAIMEQVANLPVAVFDRDEDDDEEEEEEEEVATYDESNNREFDGDDAGVARLSLDPTSEEDWFSQKRSLSTSSVRRARLTPASSLQSMPTVPGPGNQRVPATPSSMATHQKLHHYFHLTALSIIHENNLHERCFDSSSRSTIDTWYQEVINQGIQFLEWHAWLINRIGAVAAAMQREEQALERSYASQSTNGSKPPGSSNSPFRAFMRRREASKAHESHYSSGLPPYGYTPSPAPPPTPRVSSSVALSFFSRLIGRRDNQDQLNADQY